MNNMQAHNVYAATPLSSSRIIFFPLLAFLSFGVSIVCFYFASTTTMVAVHVVCILIAITILFIATYFIKTTFDHIEQFNQAHRMSMNQPLAPQQSLMYGGPQSQDYGEVYAGQTNANAMMEKRV